MYFIDWAVLVGNAPRAPLLHCCSQGRSLSRFRDWSAAACIALSLVKTYCMPISGCVAAYYNSVEFRVQTIVMDRLNFHIRKH